MQRYAPIDQIFILLKYWFPHSEFGHNKEEMPNGKLRMIYLLVFLDFPNLSFHVKTAYFMI